MSLRSTEPGERLCSSWHRSTPSRSACARSKTTAEGHTTRWLGGRTLQSISQRPHCRHCSMAPAVAAGPPAQGSARAKVRRPRGIPPARAGLSGRGGASRGQPRVPAAPPSAPSSSSSSSSGFPPGRRSRPRAAAGWALGSARVPLSHTQVPAGPGPGSTQPAAAALSDPPHRAPHSALWAPRGRCRSCPARDKGPVGLSLCASGPGLPSRRRFVSPRAGSALRARRSDSAAPRRGAPGALGGGGRGHGWGGEGAGPARWPGPSPRPKHRPRPPTSCPAAARESCGGRGLRLGPRPGSRRLNPRGARTFSELTPWASDLACGVMARSLSVRPSSVPLVHIRR